MSTRTEAGFGVADVEHEEFLELPRLVRPNNKGVGEVAPDS